MIRQIKSLQRGVKVYPDSRHVEVELEGGILILLLLYRFITVISREVALQRGKRNLRQFYCQIAKGINVHNKSEEL